MKEQLIEYSTAKLAKEKGFFIEGVSMYREDGKVARKASDYIFGNTYCRVTQSLLQKWLREKHGIDIMVTPYYNTVKSYKSTFETEMNMPTNFGYFKTYEQALETALKEGLNTL